VARAGRLWVEGVHDAELVEKVWGDDLRIEGVVVERLDGIDHLARAVADFRPGPARRSGVLVDHLVAGSKEARLAESVRHPDVLVTGTPFVDVWQAVRPSVLGIGAWPHIPKGTEWKVGICAELGLGDPPAAWRRILASVSSYADLEPALVGSVERLIDFVTSTDWPAGRGCRGASPRARWPPAGPMALLKGLCPLGGQFPRPYSRMWVASWLPEIRGRRPVR